MALLDGDLDAQHRIREAVLSSRAAILEEKGLHHVLMVLPIASQSIGDMRINPARWCTHAAGWPAWGCQDCHRWLGAYVRV